MIVGWKYELDGSRADAIARARKQIQFPSTDACVVNGSAYGEGFGFLTRESEDLPPSPRQSRAFAHFLPAGRWKRSRSLNIRQS